MAMSNRDRVGKAMDLLQAGLVPFIERELSAKHGDAWFDEARTALGTATQASKSCTAPDKIDTAAALSILVGHWQYVFRYKLGKTDRSFVGELQDTRNKWAHQEPFSLDDTNRALDSTKRLLLSVNAPEADEVDRLLQEVLRQKFDEMGKKEAKKAAATAVESGSTTGLPSWRDVVTPHDDVGTGRYMLAEFAADLWQVYQSQIDPSANSPKEYSDPSEFFRRTFLTEGLGDLLSLGIRRISGQAADPVVKLQTNFGGGKTHSMLALYHVCGDKEPTRLTGVEQLLKKLGMSGLPKKIHRAVLVGNKLSLTGSKKPDGTVVRTMWGEMAWQLGASAGNPHEAYDMVRADDEAGVCPADIEKLLKKYSPCLVLIDEWVAFVRQLYNTPGLAAGSFDANITFAQSLTEAFKAAPGAFLVASLPASDIEIGGEGGREALKRLENTFDRVQSTWRPATTEECFEIVRRRLFQPMSPANYAKRDAVAKAFVDMYDKAAGDFPSECKSAEYERRVQNSYPIHPELFDRLFQDWSTLERFQKTRGVLRLMASVIHSLWEQQDGNLLILPATIPMYDAPVRDELTRYMDDPWTPVIEKDVDGPNSLPLRLDRENPAFGRVSAARRVARTLYLGSAPNSGSTNRGIDDKRIKLGCVQPGEAPATFGDALRRLSDQATHVYVDQGRYWLATQPSVTRMAQDRAGQLERRPDDIHEEIVRRIRDQQGSRGDFARVHPCPNNSGEVVDELDARLVILRPDQLHWAKSTDSPALKVSQDILEHRGTGSRYNRNTLVFLAPDRARMAELAAAVRQYMAWSSIDREATELNLDAFQAKQAKSKAREADETVNQRLPETYTWLLVPCQSNAQAPIEWAENRLQGSDKLAVRASRKLANDGNLNTQLAGPLLRMELDRVPLWRGENVSVKQLIEDFAQYIYLPRLKGPEVLLGAIRDGVGNLNWRSETFAYADAWDDAKKRYLGLKAGDPVAHVANDSRSLVVRSEAADRQIKADAQAAAAANTGGPTSGTSAVPPGGATNASGASQAKAGPTPPSTPKIARNRFYGSVEVDPMRLGREAAKIATDVLAHINGLTDAKVTVRIEIEAQIPGGVDTNIARAVTENCKVMGFTSFGFEDE